MFKKILFAVLPLLVVGFAYGQTWNELTDLAIAAAEKGENDKAIVYMEKALPLAKKELGKNSADYSTIMNVLVILYIQGGYYEKAEPLCIECIAILKTTLGENHWDYGQNLFRLAAIYGYMGQYEKAEPLYIRSGAIIKQLKGENNSDYAGVLCNLGGLYTAMGQYGKAEQLLNESIDIIKRIFGSSHPYYATNINVLGLLYFNMGLYDKAEGLYLESAAIRKKVLGEMHPDYAQSLNNLALVYQEMGQYEKALPLYIEATSIRKKAQGENHPDYAQSLHNLASIYVDMGQYEKAEPLFIESISIKKTTVGEAHPDYAAGLNDLGSLYMTMGLYEKAEPLFIKCTAIWKLSLGESHPDYAMSLFNLGTLYDKVNNYSKAELVYEESKNILLQNTKINFSFLSEKEKENYISKVSFYFWVYQSFYYTHSKEKPAIGVSAFDVQLATKGMILNSGTQLRQNIQNSGDTTLVKLNDEWKTTKINISQQYSKPITERNPDLKKWEDNANRLEKELTKLSSSFASSQQNLQTKWSDIQLQLKQNEVAVEFISFNYYNGERWTDSVFYVANIIRPDTKTPIYISLFEERQLKGLFKADSLRTFANLLYTDAQIRTEEHDISYGDSLYQLIWQPLEPYLKDIKNINYSPSGLLHSITFDAIPMSDDIVLSDKYNLHRLTTTTKIIDKDSTSFTPSSISLFGGIQYNVDVNTLKQLAANNKSDDKIQFNFSTTRSLEDTASRGGFNYLAGSKIEVENIEGLFNKNKINTQVYSEQYGTEEAVKNLDAKNSPSIIHFSTHGFFFPDPETKKEDLNRRALDHDIVFKYSDNPLFRSGLIMAGAEYVWKGNPPIEGVEDGILTAYEVSNLYLPNTKLVVMSACETGLGDIKGSEGVYGLQRAFKMAGVEYIIMTLWQVLDKETSDFMTLFYQNLITKKSIPDAFKAAQDVMKNKYRDEPYKWAGFVLIK